MLFSVAALIGSAAASFSGLELPYPFFQQALKNIPKPEGNKAVNAPGLCYNNTKSLPRPKNRQNHELKPPVCPLNVGDLWFLCEEYSYLDAADACAAYGWRLAVIDESNEQQASQILTGCSGYFLGGAWIAGSEGVAANPCMVALSYGPFGGVFTNFGSNFCNAIKAPALCQEMPAQERTFTVPNYISTESTRTFTTTTEVSTVTYTPSCRVCSSSESDCSSSSSSSSDTCHCDSSSSDCSSSSGSACGCNHCNWGCQEEWNHWKAKTGEKRKEPYCYGKDCLPVCSESAIGIHILEEATTYLQAEEECNKYGWTLLDLTNSKQFALQRLMQQCGLEGPFSGIGYIRSFNGVHANCTVAGSIEPFDNMIVGMGFSGLLCRVYDVGYPICQEQCPIATGVGADPGQFTTADLVFTTPSLTETVITETVTSTKSCTETTWAPPVFVHN